MPADTAHPAAAARAGAAHEHPRVVGLHPPAVLVLAPFGPRPVEVAVEDVPAGHGELALDVERGHRLDAGAAARVAREAVGERLGELLVEGVEVAGGDRGASGVVV